MYFPFRTCTDALAERIGAVSTTRHGGVSPPPFESLNLGFHVGDEGENVETNRRIMHKAVEDRYGDALSFCWLSQVHGTTVVDAKDIARTEEPVEADASISRSAGLACVVMTADCLPVLLCDRQATVVAAAHAGWRGLADGIVEHTVEAMDVDPTQIIAWLGPAIGPDVFEIGAEVRDIFLEADSGAEHCFGPSPFHDDHWVADLYELARRRLRYMGIEEIFGGGRCTYTNEEHFFSYRRDGNTGRMATAIWLRKS